MKVSIITPTFEREHFLPNLYACFASQTYADVELLVLDDSPVSSTFFATCADPRVKYVHQTDRQTNGQKRNVMAGQATGDIIAHFDDDDYYAPNYIETMVSLLGERDLITLDSWYIYSICHHFFGYWDKALVLGVHYALSPAGVQAMPFETVTPEDINGYLLGYGFTYMYRKKAWASVTFENLHHRSDYHFVQALIQRGCEIATVADQQGLVLHTISTNNVSRAFPQYRLPEFLLPMIFGEGIRPFLDVKVPGKD